MADDPISLARTVLKEFKREAHNKKQDQNGRYILQQKDVESVSTRLRQIFSDGTDIPRDLGLNFDGCCFPETIKFSSWHYPEIRFNHCKFEKGITLTDVSVVHSLAFSSCDLNQEGNEDNVLTLERVRVAGSVDFDSSKIRQIKCIDTEFSGKISIQKSVIETLVGGVFKEETDVTEKSRIHNVDSVSFKGSVKFLLDGAHSCAISKCKFGGRTIFGHQSQAQNVHGLMLQDCMFHENVFFMQLNLLKETTIQRTSFSKRCEFRGCHFKEQANFVDVIFHVPPFFTAGYSLSSDTHFLRCTFKSTKTTYDLTAYRELRRIAREVVRSSVDEGKFFALEQRTLTSIEWKEPPRRWHATISTLYWLGSNYGQSVVRPILGFGLVTGAAWLVFCSFAATPDVGEHVKFLRDKPVLGLILQNIFAPFTYFGKAAAFTPIDIVGVATSAVQSLLSLLLLALFALSVRRRLRKESE